jgi:hypothetical protein
MKTPEALMNISPFLLINHSCDEALQWTKEQLLQAGLHPIQTFDLHTARLAMHNCPCPNHGTEDCDCQMVVVLVYGKVAEPATLILHGNNGQTWVSIVNDPQQRVDAKTMTLIQQTLEVKPAVPMSRGR